MTVNIKQRKGKKKKKGRVSRTSAVVISVFERQIDFYIAKTKIYGNANSEIPRLLLCDVVLATMALTISAVKTFWKL